MLPRLLRVRVLDALERRVNQFRSREDVWPFRVPHEPIALDDVIEEALAGERRAITPDRLRSRTVLRMEWDASASHGAAWWEAWAIALPSGVHVYCDESPDEARVLASIRRGQAAEADGFFLDLLAEAGGVHLGIELAGDLPDRVRSSMSDREFLREIFLELFEDAGETAVDRWLDRALVVRAPDRRAGRVKRLREYRERERP